MKKNHGNGETHPPQETQMSMPSSFSTVSEPGGHSHFWIASMKSIGTNSIRRKNSLLEKLFSFLAVFIQFLRITTRHNKSLKNIFFSCQKKSRVIKTKKNLKKNVAKEKF